MSEPNSRASIRTQSIWRLVVPPLLVLAAVGLSILAFYSGRQERDSLDADLCPVEREEIGGSAVLLYDFTKPLRTDQASLPSELLRDVALLMERNVELRIFSLAGSLGSPRTFLKRLCKPYANADLQIKTAKDQRGTMRDCDDLPAQLPVETRESATAFCGQLGLMSNQLDAMVQTDWPMERRVQGAYLVEALEDVVLELDERPEPHALYVVSDMMQHAKWYSHLDDAWTNWSYESFAELKAAQNWGNVNGQGFAGKQVEIFYVPRDGMTDQPRTRQVHQNFWRNYFAGSDVAFHNQLTGSAYFSVPLMNVLTEAEQAIQERQIVEELLLQVREEQEALEQQRKESLQRLEAEQSQLERERNRLRLMATQRAAAEAAGDRTAEEPVEEAAAADGAIVQTTAAVRPPESSSTPVGAEASGSADEGAGEAVGVDVEATPGVAQADEDVDGTPPPEPIELVSTPEPTVSTEQPMVRETLAQEQEPESPDLVQEPAPQRTSVACRLRLSPQSGRSSPDYPRGGRMNFGSAMITVRYVVDAQGATVDDEVMVVAEESQSERERYFDLFAAEAVATVKGWQFTFEESVEGACAGGQSGTISFEFEYSYR